MAYVKQTWSDREVENPMTFTMVQNADNTITLTPAPGTILSDGSLIEAERMNHIEDGVYSNSLGVAPIGSVFMFAGSTTPDNYLICSGQAISRETYSSLYTLIGTTYGSGDGSTTFNLPNIKGKIPVGLDSSDTDFNTLGGTGGAKSVTLTVQHLPINTYVDSYSTRYVNNDGGGTWINNRGGGGQAHNNLQPYITLNYIIRVS